MSAPLYRSNYWTKHMRIASNYGQPVAELEGFPQGLKNNGIKKTGKL